MKTDLTFDDVKEIATGYSGAKNIKQVQLQGKSDMIDGVSYEVVSQSEERSKDAERCIERQIRRSLDFIQAFCLVKNRKIIHVHGIVN